jgi:hypothetical protein
MLLGLVLLLCLVTVPLAGGRLGALASVRFRWRGAVLAGIALQVVIISVVPGGAPWLHDAVHVLSYGLVAAFVARNLGLPGIGLLALGGGLNFAAITANGGVMPADPDAVRRAGLPLEHADYINSAVVAHPRLAPLGDVFAVPASFPIHNVYSIGDVLIVVGALVFLHRLSGSRLGGRRAVVERVELVRASQASWLVRVAGRALPDTAPDAVQLVVADGAREQVLPALPAGARQAPPGPGFRAAFHLPAAGDRIPLGALRLRLPGLPDLDLREAPARRGG